MMKIGLLLIATVLMVVVAGAVHLIRCKADCLPKRAEMVRIESDDSSVSRDLDQGFWAHGAEHMPRAHDLAGMSMMM